jgi:CTP synthase (UTP-ammonia lyase)
MPTPLVIGVIGDYDGRPSHVATNAALGHAAARLGLELEIRWLPTPALLAPGAEAALAACDGLWASPGSPYRSLDGALAGIRFARERDWPFTGT